MLRHATLLGCPSLKTGERRRSLESTLTKALFRTLRGGHRLSWGPEDADRPLRERGPSRRLVCGGDRRAQTGGALCWPLPRWSWLDSRGRVALRRGQSYAPRLPRPTLGGSSGKCSRREGRRGSATRTRGDVSSLTPTAVRLLCRLVPGPEGRSCGRRARRAGPRRLFRDRTSAAR